MHGLDSISSGSRLTQLELTSYKHETNQEETRLVSPLPAEIITEIVGHVWV